MWNENVYLLILGDSLPLIITIADADEGPDSLIYAFRHILNDAIMSKLA